MVGLHSGTHSKAVVLGGVLTIAVSDAFSDALGIHISEESESRHTTWEIWQSTIFTFLSKFFVASLFMVPIIIFTLGTAIIVSVLSGLILLMVFSWHMAKEQRTAPLKVILEHLFIALFVIAVTHYLGDWIAESFR